uniref:Uncharacterized protein n=1 Tax=Meloidogyne incognita TaxID=6306 RepID=A0A914M4Q3_MELIC
MNSIDYNFYLTFIWRSFPFIVHEFNQTQRFLTFAELVRQTFIRTKEFLGLIFCHPHPAYP